MPGFGRMLVAGVMALALSACGITSLPYDRSTAGIKSIGVVTPGRFEDTNAILVASVGRGFGLIGALIDAGITSSRSTRLRTLLAEQNFVPLASLQDEIIQSLEAGGYAASPVSGVAERREFLNASPAASSPVDAYLDIVVLGHGYQATGIARDTPWRPYVTLRVRLVRMSDSAVLMQNTIAYNPSYTVRETITISADPAYQFTTFDDLAAEPQKATRGLKAAMEQTAKTIATLLR